MKLFLTGKGKMANRIADLAMQAGDEVTAMEDALSLDNPDDLIAQSDVIIDFSHPANFAWYKDAAIKHQVPVVLGTTGFDAAGLEAIHQAAKQIPVFFSSNYSLGVALLKKVSAMAAKLLDNEWDIEIVETHHNQKADAPSGTALSLLEAVDFDGSHEMVCGRSGQHKRQKNEIGMHSLRGGTVPGKHTVSFFGPDESIHLEHNAQSRDIFAAGALKAARFVNEADAGLYSMDELLELSLNKDQPETDQEEN